MVGKWDVTRYFRKEGRVPLSLQQREMLAALAFIAPWIIGFLVFTAGPMLVSLVLSFTDYSVLEPAEFVGLENYKQMLTDSRLRTSIMNTFFYAALFVPLSLSFALFLALLLNNAGKASGFFRTAFYMPSMTPSVAVGTLWLWLLNPRVGLVNKALELVGIDGPGWTTDPNWIKPGIVLMSLWGVGGTVIIYLAGLRNVPEVLYEAAYVDGANAWRRFRHITLPMMSGVIFFTLVVNTISALQIFTEVFTMFFGNMRSGPASSAGLFYNIYLFRQAFEFFHMGYASSMAWLLFVIILALTIIQLSLRQRWVYYEGE
jgi:multiple sugar transport system permease protein